MNPYRGRPRHGDKVTYHEPMHDMHYEGVVDWLGAMQFGFDDKDGARHIVLYTEEWHLADDKVTTDEGAELLSAVEQMKKILEEAEVPQHGRFWVDEHGVCRSADTGEIIHNPQAIKSPPKRAR